MTELEEILNNITGSVNSYHSMHLQNNLKLSEILRSLNSNLFYLAEHRIEAYNKWIGDYFNNKSKMSNAAAEREADKSVPELYKIRYIMSSTKAIVDGIRSQIGIYRSEN